MTTQPDPMLPLPGLDDPKRPPTNLEAAVRRTIAALESTGLVEERHAARLQLALDLANIISLKQASGRLSTVANDARVLMELLDKILPEDTGVDDALREAMRAWAEEVTHGERASDADSEIRDET